MPDEVFRVSGNIVDALNSVIYAGTLVNGHAGPIHDPVLFVSARRPAVEARQSWSYRYDEDGIHLNF